MKTKTELPRIEDLSRAEQIRLLAEVFPDVPFKIAFGPSAIWKLEQWLSDYCAWADYVDELKDAYERVVGGKPSFAEFCILMSPAQRIAAMLRAVGAAR